MRFYQALLYLYPAAFRDEYAREMASIYQLKLRKAAGVAERVMLRLRAVGEILTNAPAVHADLLRQDLRYTLRTLARTPGFTVTAILITALGIGATTAAFTMADHVLIRPLPYADSERLVELWENPPGYRMEPSPPNYRDWRQMSRSFEAMGAYRGLSVNLSGSGEPERLEGAAMTWELLPMLGIRPVVGRYFAAEDDRTGAEGTLLLSYAYWQNHFAGDPGVVGTKVLLDGEAHTIIGVMPSDFSFPNREAQIWTPMRFGQVDFQDRNNNFLHVVAKLRPTVSLETARSEMKVVAASLERAFPADNAKTGAEVVLLRDEVPQDARTLLAALMGASLCVLLIACTNLASLLLAKTLARQKELAVRTSLGAGRQRLVRQLLTESAVLAGTGGALGVAAAFAILPLLARLIPQALPISATPAIDLRIILFSGALTVLTGAAFGVAPALRGAGWSPAAGLREGVRGGTGPAKERLRSTLVAVEVTITVVLLIASGLLLRALVRLQSSDPGFRTEGVLTMRTSLPMPKYEQTLRREQFYSRVLAETRALPGVEKAAYISFLPIAMRGGVWPVSLTGQPQDYEEAHTASLRFVTPDFFGTLGISLRAGRDVAESDTAKSQFVTVVSESFAKRYWPGENPIGRHFTIGFAERTVIGVVADIAVRGLGRKSEPQVYLPYQQVPDGGLSWYAPKDLVIRTTGDPRQTAGPVREIIRRVDPAQPVSDVQLLEDLVASDTAPRRLQITVLGSFAAVAILLAGIGIHGLLSFTVSQRAQEFGIRMALGARPSQILGLVLTRSMKLAIGGIGAGVLLGYTAGRWMESVLAGVAPWDLTTVMCAAGLMVAMASAGTLGPAARALRTNPASVIRTE